MATQKTIQEKIIDAWVERITKKMVSNGASFAEFICGEDYQSHEEHWIRNTLVPALKDYEMVGAFYPFAKKGEISSCDCHASVCEHSGGQKFRVSLASK